MSVGDRHVLVLPGAGSWQPAPAQLRGIVARRVFAYIIDLIIILMIEGLALLVFVPAALLSFGLLWGPLMAVFGLIPIAYHTLMIGGWGAGTVGQRLLDLRVTDAQDGGNPSYVQAFVQSGVFYVTATLTSFLILLVVFFNPARRTLHDWASGTLVLRRSVETTGPHRAPTSAIRP